MMQADSTVYKTMDIGSSWIKIFLNGLLAAMETVRHLYKNPLQPRLCNGPPISRTVQIILVNHEHEC
jgi:hypothetical protein